ncbi:MAG: ABC transporter ATP-binding protein [Actinomycetota bacterium]|nr:ABC transporter ATP-binding protein [Actinomycetota bacterium]
MADAAISIENVSKRFRIYHDRNQTLKSTVMRGRRARYEDFWALKDVSFEIERGETFGIIGHNGSGKSTMLKCLAKILRPEEGRIEVRGTISSLLELGAGFHPELTGRENIYLNASILGLSRHQVDERFDEIVEFADLEHFIDMPVKNYSSGMYVRLGFAVAINVDPEILMIDEVLSVGDELFQRKSSERIAHFRDSNRTVVIVSHGLDQVRSLCDRVAWLDHGELQMVGPAPEVVDAYTGETVVDRETNAEGVTTRWGSGEARITEVELLDAAGNPARSVRTGEGLIIRIHFVAHERIIDPSFGIAIEHIDGQLMTATNTTRQNQTVKEIDGPGIVDVRIPAVTLAEGTYDLDVAIGERTERNDYDHWRRPIRFDVKRGEGVPVGYLDLGIEFGLDRTTTDPARRRGA